MPIYDWWVYIVLALPGIFFYGMNWAIFIHNVRGGKFVSCVPALGGLWIAIVCLLSPIKWLALLGLTDPGCWLFIAAIFMEFRKPDEIQKDEPDENDPEDPA